MAMASWILMFQDASHNMAGWLMNPDGTIREARAWPNTGAWEVRACADYSGVARDQVIFQEPGGTLARWLLNADGTIKSVSVLGTSTWPLRGACDLDGDGKADLLFQNSAGTLAVWTHNANGSLRGQVLFGAGTWGLAGTVDIDGDGVPDLLCQTPDYLPGRYIMATNLTYTGLGYWGATPGWKLRAAGR